MSQKGNGYKIKGVVFITTLLLFAIFITLSQSQIHLGNIAHAAILVPQTQIVSSEKADIIEVEQGTMGEYKFFITNKGQEGISQVKMTYQLSIITALEYQGKVMYSLYHSNEKGIYDETTDLVIGQVEGSLSEVSDEKMILPSNSEKVDYYVVRFNPDSIGDFNFHIKVKSIEVK